MFRIEGLVPVRLVENKLDRNDPNRRGGRDIRLGGVGADHGEGDLIVSEVSETAVPLHELFARGLVRRCRVWGAGDKVRRGIRVGIVLRTLGESQSGAS